MTRGPSGAPLRPGDRVVVREREVTGHARTPGYVKGRPGVVVARRGVWPNPELLAHGHEDPRGSALFSVEFRQQALWDDYDGSPADRVTVDLYEHWLDREA